MAITLRHLILALVLGCLCAELPAQPAQPPKGEPRATVVRFYYHSLQDPSSEDEPNEPRLTVNLVIDKTPIEIDVGINNISQDITFLGPGPLILHSSQNIEQGTSGKVVATVPLPPGVKGVLYLVTYSENKYHFKPIPFSADDVPLNHVKVLNLCPEPLAVQFGASQSVVPRQGEVTLDVSGAEKFMAIKVARQMGDYWRKDINMTARSAKPGKKLLFILLPDSASFNKVNMLSMGPMP